MRIGLQDAKHFAIIAGAGGAGLVATLWVYSAIRGPEMRYHHGVTIDLVGTSGEVVVHPPGLVVDPTSGELRARVGWKRKPGRGGLVYPARPGLLAEEKPVIYGKPGKKDQSGKSGKKEWPKRFFDFEPLKTSMLSLTARGSGRSASCARRTSGRARRRTGPARRTTTEPGGRLTRPGSAPGDRG